eukprot:COSAG01_NODE_800_length_13475_cov_24.171725_9_plen_59_part_00
MVLVTCNALLTQLRVEMPSTVVHVNGAPLVNWTRGFLLEYTVLFLYRDLQIAVTLSYI